MRKIRQEDQVIVIAGRDKGKRGEVVRVLDDDRLVVAGVNLVKKHQRANPQANQQGGILEREAPIHVSNVAIYNEESDRPDRVGIRVEDGRRVRYFKSDGSLVDGE
ncbi:MAG: 50S ribosomal protein L24 [Gammaproteobacteria bacterium]|nr:50S ribosomal protein L24 [Gammaproteobacteria bacterium]MYE80897.1 50S ribosomal protein L24 [Gammaproteobacteria bacterium]